MSWVGVDRYEFSRPFLIVWGRSCYSWCDSFVQIFSIFRSYHFYPELYSFKDDWTSKSALRPSWDTKLSIKTRIIRMRHQYSGFISVISGWPGPMFHKRLIPVNPYTGLILIQHQCWALRSGARMPPCGPSEPRACVLRYRGKPGLWWKAPCCCLLEPLRSTDKTGWKTQNIPTHSHQHEAHSSTSDQHYDALWPG